VSEPHGRAAPQAERERAGPRRGRLRARPQAAPPGGPATPAAITPGLQPLGLEAGRDGPLYVPASHAAGRPAPLVLMLHGAGGNARGGLRFFLDRADAAGLLLVAPESRLATWDVLVGGYGPDVAYVDRALAQVFARYAVDPSRVAVEGFSDGASYALSLGLTNGDLFTHVLAFSPGFAAPETPRGSTSATGCATPCCPSTAAAGASCRSSGAPATTPVTTSSTARTPFRTRS
jgi:phospholipase/carboxylesterase